MINSGIIIVDMTVTTLDRCKQELNIVSCRRHWTRLYSTPITWSRGLHFPGVQRGPDRQYDRTIKDSFSPSRQGSN